MKAIHLAFKERQRAIEARGPKLRQKSRRKEASTQQTDGRRRSHGSVARLLRCGACRPALVEVTVLRTHQLHSGERLCSLDEVQPTPAIEQAGLLVQGLQACLISDLTNDYASDWVTCLPPAIDVHVAVQMISEDTVDGHPLVQFARRNHACKYCAKQCRRTAADDMSRPATEYAVQKAEPADPCPNSSSRRMSNTRNLRCMKVSCCTRSQS